MSVVVVCDTSVVYCDNLHDPNLSLTRRVTTEVRITRFLHKSTAPNKSLTSKFEGGPFDQGAQTEVGWFLTSRCYISEIVRDRAQVTINH